MFDYPGRIPSWGRTLSPPSRFKELRKATLYLLYLFVNVLPKRVEPAVRYGVIGLTNRTYYFEYRNGSRLIPPALQEDIRKLFRDNGWTEEVKFDGYIEDYDW
jgi:hypothetical protein